jgi:cysteine-rich repeat protein
MTAVWAAGCGGKSGGGGEDICGDGVIDTDLGEECDDGNVADGDGCDSVCAVEPGYVCTGEPSVCVWACDDNDGDFYGDGDGCLGPDCDDNNIDVNPGATEVCNGIDDDCNSQTDEQGDVPCYDGPAGTEGVGRCQPGVIHCINGAPGPCIGQVQPGMEACNLVDDDCDGETDEDTVTLTCGIGECAASTSSCVGGVVQQCTPGNPTPEQCDGLDNDCNGLIDDSPSCGCVHVAPFGDDTNGDGSEGAPLATINAGIALAAQAGPPIVCVAAATNCAWTFYNEDVVMVDGVSVYGGYDPNNSPWTQEPLHQANPTCVTEIRSQTDVGLYFGPTVALPTILHNFAASLQNPGATSAVITVEGATGTQINSCSVFGADTGTTTYGIHVTEDTSTNTPATPLITSTNVEGGAGTTSIAIYSYRSAPVIQSNCSPANITAGNRCLHGCINGIHIRANRFTGNPAQLPDIGYGILLEESPGSVVDQSMVCGSAVTEVAAIKIIGDAAGTVITRNDVTVWGALMDHGVWALDCNNAAPWIADNERLGAEGDPSGQAVVAAVRATGECHPLIEANILIVGGIEGQTNTTRGVHCDRSTATGAASRCDIINNVEIRGSNNNFPNDVTGVLCEDGSCNVISGNQLIHGNRGVNVVGIRLVGPTNAFIDSNRIEGGCGTTFAAAILGEDGSARIQNNSIFAGMCGSGGAGSQFFGIFGLLAAGTNELDIHSNMIHGGGDLGAACESRGISFDIVGGATPPAGPLGIVRNNIIEAGDCNTNWSVEERSVDADPRFLENNDLLWPGAVTALYLDEFATQLTLIADVNAMTDITVSANIDQDPQWTILGSGFATIPAGSPCQNAGTATGAPALDFQGDVRPQENDYDIGPDEYVP